MARPLALLSALAMLATTLGLAATAAAQMPASPPPGYGGAPQGYGPGYGTSPGYAPPNYGNGYGYGPPQGPPPPPPPRQATCCSWSVRANPFDLIFRRLSLEGELAVIGPLTVQISPSWIWGSPTENVDASGFALAGEIGGYFSGKPFKGWWLKGYAGIERFEATITAPAGNGYAEGSASKTVSSPIFGGMIGSTSVFGRTGGFVISGGLGIGVATADQVTIVACQSPTGTLSPDGASCVEANWYDKGGRIQLLGSFSLGAAF